MFDDLLMIHIVSTSIMVGVIWIMQLVHYPSFKYVKESNYIIFQKWQYRQDIVSEVTVKCRILGQ